MASFKTRHKTRHETRLKTRHKTRLKLNMDLDIKLDTKIDMKLLSGALECFGAFGCCRVLLGALWKLDIDWT